MKHVLIFSFLLVAFGLNAQITTPASSPTVKMEQDLGLGSVTIEYSRPGMKDRQIFGANGLVPYGQKWRLGANRATKVTFSDDVQINGNDLEAGSYAILATPSAGSWAFEFHPHTSGSWSSYVEKDPVLRVKSSVKSLSPSMETFTIMTSNHTDNSASLDFMWDKSLASLEVSTDVDKTVMANIEQVMSGPSANDMYQAASYYHKSGKDLSQALSWIEQATAGDDPKFWQVRRKALILADMGKTKQAIQAATMSMELAEKAGNADYVSLNKKSIMEWSK